MKLNLLKKAFFMLLVITFLLVFTLSNNVKATNEEQAYYNPKEISEEMEKEDSNYEEDKIMKYDAKTGKTTEVNMEELTQKASKFIKVNPDNSLSIDSIEPLFISNSNYKIPSYSTYSASRDRITNTTIPPYSAICRIKYKKDGRSFIGSGTLVSSNVVLTAAHCVFDEENNNAKFADWEAQPGYNNHTYKGLSSGWSQVYYSNNWFSKHSYEDDWAVCVLNEDLGDDLGAFGLTYVPEDNSYLDNLEIRTYRISY